MKKIISILILALLLSSCVTRRVCDSTNTLTVIRDTTIYVKIPGDTVGTSVLLNDVVPLNSELPSVPLPESSVLNTPLATSTIWLKDGRLHHRLEQKDTTVATTLKGVLKTTHKTTNKTIQKTTYKNATNRSQKEGTIQQSHPTNQLTGWQWTQVYLGRAFLVMVGVWILLKIRI